jgi:PIN domain nuclease of toxin-antitoxin system
VILDTQALIWWLGDDDRLPIRARDHIRRSDVVMVSSASAWEIAKGQRLGKLKFKGWDSASLPALLEAAGFDVLPISIAHALEAGRLAGPHADPFDRILIAQCKIERVPLVTRDPIFREYGVDVIW